jgi:hypothetical protein
MNKKIPFDRKYKFNRFKYLICKVMGHKFVPIEMDETTHRLAWLNRCYGDFHECTRCHGRSYL